MQDVHDPYAALRHHDYRRLLSGSMLASLGTQMQGVAVGWELYRRTGSPLDLGLVGLVQFAPVLLLSLPAGHAADRYSRKGLLLAAQALMALTSLGLATLSFLEGPVPLVYLCLLGAGVSRAFNAPARWSLLPEVVPPDHLANAVTWNSSAWQIASVVGPALGGGVIWASGQRAAATYLLTALCCAVCAGLIATIRPQTRPHPARGVSLACLLAGIRFVWSTKVILATITLDLFAVLLGGATALLPVYASDILHVGAAGLGWLRAAPSLGALVMALVLAHRPPLRRAGLTLLWAVAGFGVATVVFGLSRNLILSFAALALVGALDNISVVVRGTLIQVLTPNAMRGRVTAVTTIFIVSSNELGEFESGVTAHYFGPVASVVAGGVGTILVVVAVLYIWPDVLRLGPLHQPGEVGPPEEAAPFPEEVGPTAVQPVPVPQPLFDGKPPPGR